MSILPAVDHHGPLRVGNVAQNLGCMVLSCAWVHGLAHAVPAPQSAAERYYDPAEPPLRCTASTWLRTMPYAQGFVTVAGVLQLPKTGREQRRDGCVIRARAGHGPGNRLASKPVLVACTAGTYGSKEHETRNCDFRRSITRNLAVQS